MQPPQPQFPGVIERSEKIPILLQKFSTKSSLLLLCETLNDNTKYIWGWTKGILLKVSWARKGIRISWQRGRLWWNQTEILANWVRLRRNMVGFVFISNKKFKVHIRALKNKIGTWSTNHVLLEQLKRSLFWVCFLQKIWRMARNCLKSYLISSSNRLKRWLPSRMKSFSTKM